MRRAGLVAAIFVLAVGAFVFFGFQYYPGLLNVLGMILMLTVLYWIFRVNASAFSFSKNEVASGIFDIYMDANESDFHVFSYHNSSRAKSGLSPLRIVQHHFFRAGAGEYLYSELFSHDLRAKKGAAGYEGFETFETSVLQSEELKESLAKFSEKSGKSLGIGRKLERKADENAYPVDGGLAVKIEKDERGILNRLSVLFINGAGFHHEADLAHCLDIVERIAGNGHHIGIFAGGDDLPSLEDEANLPVRSDDAVLIAVAPPRERVSMHKSSASMGLTRDEGNTVSTLSQ